MTDELTGHWLLMVTKSRGRERERERDWTSRRPETLACRVGTAPRRRLAVKSIDAGAATTTPTPPRRRRRRRRLTYARPITYLSTSLYLSFLSLSLSFLSLSPFSFSLSLLRRTLTDDYGGPSATCEARPANNAAARAATVRTKIF